MEKTGKGRLGARWKPLLFHYFSTESLDEPILTKIPKIASISVAHATPSTSANSFATSTYGYSISDDPIRSDPKNNSVNRPVPTNEGIRTITFGVEFHRQRLSQRHSLRSADTAWHVYQDRSDWANTAHYAAL